MIRITQGTYGYRDGAVIRPISPADEPFSLSPAEEQRLVARGVAQYVAEPTFDDVKEEVDEGTRDIPADFPEYHADMPAAELRDIAALLGLTFKASTSRAKIVEAIDQSFLTSDVEQKDDDDQPPTFNPEEAVQ